MFGVDDLFGGLMSSKSHAGSNDPNNPWFQGGSGNLYAKDIFKVGKHIRDTMPTWYKEAPTPGADGFMWYQRAGLNTLASNLFSKISGDMSARGFNFGQNNDAVVGSALTQAAPALFQIQNENQMLPHQLVAARAENASIPAQIWSSGGAFSRGPGLGYNWGRGAQDNWWGMLNNIGSAWGSLGANMKVAGAMGGAKGKG